MFKKCVGLRERERWQKREGKREKKRREEEERREEREKRENRKGGKMERRKDNVRGALIF